jgi:hypothetical protein
MVNMEQQLDTDADTDADQQIGSQRCDDGTDEDDQLIAADLVDADEFPR